MWRLKPPIFHRNGGGRGGCAWRESITYWARGRPQSRSDAKWRIPHWTGDLAEGLRQPGVEAVILATPTQIHARQAEQCMLAGKHVLVEIPMADTLADAERLVRLQKETGVVAMAGHVRRFRAAGRAKAARAFPAKVRSGFASGNATRTKR